MIRTLEPGDQWDQTLIRDLLEQVDHREAQVIIVPGRYWHDKTAQVNKTIAKDTNPVVIITGDEENLFPTEQLQHKNLTVWIQSPHKNKPHPADRYIGIGYTPTTRNKTDRPNKTLRFFFAGQNTHSRRRAAIKEYDQMPGGKLIPTKGFTQGIPPEQYTEQLRSAQVAPCPAGAVIPDTFRLYEALEAGAVPIADGKDPNGGNTGYWPFLFDTETLPFPILEDWEDAPGTTNFFNDTAPIGQNRCFAWWQQQKRTYRKQLEQDCGAPKPKTTILMPTSPIAGHPDTTIIEETIAAARHHLPETEIIIMIDGIREEQWAYKDKYEEYINRLLWITNQDPNITPLLFQEHQHQAKMTRAALKQVDSPTIIFMEHDTPLVTDYKIPFGTFIKFIEDGQADVVRLHHEAAIHPEHKHLMVTTEPTTYHNQPFLKTAQWSQRPHVAGTEYYRQLLEHIPEDQHTMIEDAVHGITQTKWLEQGQPGWNQHRLWMYAPEGNMKRSYHLDGRGADPKWT